MGRYVLSSIMVRKLIEISNCMLSDSPANRKKILALRPACTYGQPLILGKLEPKLAGTPYCRA